MTSLAFKLKQKVQKQQIKINVAGLSNPNKNSNKKNNKLF